MTDITQSVEYIQLKKSIKIFGIFLTIPVFMIIVFIVMAFSIIGMFNHGMFQGRFSLFFVIPFFMMALGSFLPFMLIILPKLKLINKIKNNKDSFKRAVVFFERECYTYSGRRYYSPIYYFEFRLEINGSERWLRTNPIFTKGPTHMGNINYYDYYQKEVEIAYDPQTLEVIVIGPCYNYDYNKKTSTSDDFEDQFKIDPSNY